MKTEFITYCAVLLSTIVTLQAEDATKPRPNSPEFERMRSLVGTWTGKVDMGQGPVDLTLDFKLIAGGSVLEERMGAGTPMEMVSMFYDKAGKLAMTHYCVFGNRPEMALKASDAKSITFDFDSCCGIDPKKESHMHEMAIEFVDADTISTVCHALVDGRETPDHAATFKRVKPETTAAK
jgi:hypothetical protein